MKLSSVTLVAALFIIELNKIGAQRVIAKDEVGIYDEKGLQSVLITFKDKEETSSKRCGALARAQGGYTSRVYSKALNGCAMYLPEAAINALANLTGIDSVEFDREVHTSENEASTSWGLDRVNQCTLPLDNLKSPVDATGVKVYIVDTGIYGDHNDFDGLIDSSSNCHSDQTDEDNPLTDGNGHGTHVASTTCGNMYGVATGCDLCAVKVLGASGSGSTAGVIAGIEHVMNNCAAGERCVANMSLGGGASTSMNDAVEAAVAAGVTMVVAAGNSNANACSYSPASATSAITVGSTTTSDTRSSFSNYGTCVDTFGPGSSIKAAWNNCDSCTNTISGTSMASPHVAGIAAGILANGATTPGQVLTEMQGSFTGPVTDSKSPPGVGLATITSCGYTQPPTPAPTICSEKLLSVAIVTDQWAGETSWTLTNVCTDELQASRSQGSYSGDETTEYCVPEAKYEFTIFDTFSDGICCSWGEGSYLVEYDGEPVASGGNFDAEESTVFGPSCGDTPPPTTAPPTPSPTTAPPTPPPTTTASPTPPTTLECNIEMMKGSYKLKWNVYDHDLGMYKDDLVQANLRVQTPNGGGKGVMKFKMCVLEGDNNQDSYLESMVAVTTGFARDSIIPVVIGTSYTGEYNCETEELMIGTSYNEQDLAFSLKEPAVKKDGGVGFPGNC